MQLLSAVGVIDCMRTVPKSPDKTEHKVTPQEALLTSGSEATTTVLRAAISALPLVGGPASELVNAILLPNLTLRRNRFFTELYYDLRKLEERIEGFRTETLAANDLFVSVAVRASQAALKDHRGEKHQALRNATLNTGIGISIEGDVQMLLIDLVDTLTPLHLSLLKFLNDPMSFPRHPDPTPRLVGANDGFFTTIEGAFPELRGKRYLSLPILNDLYNRGLSQIGMSSTDDLILTGFQMSTNAVEPKNTWLGGLLLQYVATPPLLCNLDEGDAEAKGEVPLVGI